MKIRNGFVSNSSSSSFYITNKTDKPLKLEDFIRENPQLLTNFQSEYQTFLDKTQDDMIQCAIGRNLELQSGRNYVVFGDEDQDIIGEVLDYILRDGGDSPSFTWTFCDHLR